MSRRAPSSPVSIEPVLPDVSAYARLYLRIDRVNRHGEGFHADSGDFFGLLSEGEAVGAQAEDQVREPLVDEPRAP